MKAVLGVIGVTVALVFCAAIIQAIWGGNSSPPQVAEATSAASDGPTDDPTEKPSPPPKPRNNAELLARAEDLYAGAVLIVDRTSPYPTSGEQWDGPDGVRAWYKREAAWQNDAEKRVDLAHVSPGDLSSADADSFLYGAVVDAVASCNRHDALLNLKVARADLDEQRRVLAGKGSSDWSPPDITDQLDNQNLCKG